VLSCGSEGMRSSRELPSRLRRDLARLICMQTEANLVHTNPGGLNSLWVINGEERLVHLNLKVKREMLDYGRKFEVSSSALRKLWTVRFSGFVQ
jgi:hypothetical protein